MSSVRKRKLSNGKVRWQRAGKRRAKQFEHKWQADDYETKVRGEIKAGTHTPESTSITVAEAGKAWAERTHGKRGRPLETTTRDQRSQHVRLHINPLIGKVKLAKLTRPMVAAFRDDLLKTISEELAKKVLTSLVGIIGDAMDRGQVNQNVAAGISIGSDKRQSKRAYIPPKEAVRRLIHKAGELWEQGMPWRPFVIVAALCGLRQSELRGLLWENVDFDKATIHVRQRADVKGKMGQPKSGAGDRDVPTAPMALNALKTWYIACGRPDKGLVFTIKGRVIRKDEIHRDCWVPLCEEAGIEYFRFHDLRHVAASAFIATGKDAKWIQTVMGHSTIVMTFDLYGHLWADAAGDAETAAKAERALFG